MLPTGFTLEHYRDAAGGAERDAVFASLVTGFVASLLALVTGAWAALALRARADRWAGPLGVLFFIPSAVPSVSVGLGLLVAFSQKPAAAQRHDRDRVRRALRADFRLRVRQHLGRAFAPGAGLRRGRLVPRRAPRSTGSCT